MDYLALDEARSRLWIPAGNTGKVFSPRYAHSRRQSIDGVLPPRPAATGRSVQAPRQFAGEIVYVGNRADRKSVRDRCRVVRGD